MPSARSLTIIVFGAALAVAMLLLAACDKDKGLKITGVDPKVVPLEGGEVVIHGKGFQTEATGDVTVYFGDRKGKVIEIEGDDKIVVRAPGGGSSEKVSVKLIFADSREFVYRDALSYADVNKGYSVDSLTDKKKGGQPEKKPANPEKDEKEKKNGK
jgi:hypothetical protein